MPILLFTFLFLLAPTAFAEPQAYHQMELSRFYQLREVQLLIPKTLPRERVYVKTEYPQKVVSASALVDGQQLISPYGDMQSSSMPVGLAQNYGKSFRNVFAFPLPPLQAAKKQLVFAFTLSNGKETRVRVEGEKLARLLQQMQ